MVKVKDLLPIIWYNDVLLMSHNREEICLIRKDFNGNILSNEYLDMEVEFIENDECVTDTILIAVKKEDGGLKL